jgi:hypothetical protein
LRALISSAAKTKLTYDKPELVELNASDMEAITAGFQGSDIGGQDSAG